MSDKVTLYSATQEFFGLLDMMEQQSEDPTPEQETAIRQAIDAHVRKVDGVARFMKHMDSQADFAAAEIKRLQERKRSIEAHQRRFEKYVLDCLEMAGVEKFDGETATITRRKNPPKLVVISEESIPAEFQTIIPQTTELDTVALKSALKAGREVPGAKLERGWRVEVE